MGLELVEVRVGEESPNESIGLLCSWDGNIHEIVSGASRFTKFWTGPFLGGSWTVNVPLEEQASAPPACQ